MSLQVWLPLTKDLRQQGLSDVNVTNNGATFNANGKLGGCYQFGTAASGIGIPKDSMTSFSEASVSFWIKILSWNTSYCTLFQAGTNNRNWSDYIFGVLRNGSGSTLCFTIGDTSSTTTSACQTSALNLNEWYHLVFTYKNKKMRIYLNGELHKEYTSSMNADFSKITKISLGRANDEQYQSNCLMNDVRIYDHCLSPMEVKEISKGLVLHYPLNRNGWGQENLILNTQVLTPNSSTTTKNCSLRESAVRQLRIDGFYEAKCTANWQGLSTWANAQNLVVGQKYTYSFYFYTDGSAKSLSFYPMMYNSSGTRDTSSTLPISVDGSTYQNGNARSFGSFSNTIPIRHYVTFEWNNTMASIISNGGTIELSIQIYGTFNNGEYGCIYAPKLEIGDKVTPWCPNSADTLADTMGLNSDIEYDISGYCNNGTRTGTFSWTSDTPKYSVSTQFNGTQYIRLPFSCGIISEAVSIAVWGYESNWNTSSAERLIGAATGGSGWCIGDYGSENTLFAFYANGGYNTAIGFKQLSAGWHHFVITFDGLHLNYYVDGQPFSSKTFSTKQIATGNYNIEIGRHYGGGCNFKGSMNDVRIYATALSADDVKSLYQNSAYIDSNGNVYGAAHSEV